MTASADVRIAQIYADNAITSEQDGVIKLLMSQNEQVRAVFGRSRDSS